MRMRSVPYLALRVDYDTLDNAYMYIKVTESV